MRAILYPVAALAALTFAVLLLIPYARFKAAFQGRVSAKDFRYGESTNVPPEVALPNRNLTNLLELPVLFYVACIIFYVTSTVDGLALTLAWLAVYAASNVVLLVLWVRLVLALN